MVEIDSKIFAAIITAIIGCYGWMIKHLSNQKKHPYADKLVYEDTCEARRDCIEESVNNLKEYSKERFDRLEELIRDGGR